MNPYLISKAKVSLLRHVLKSTFAVMVLACMAACSSSDDYEIFAKIHGTVTDYETGEPLENASVVLSPSGRTKQTDASGYYLFEELDALQYAITVQKTGYITNRKIVDAISGEDVEISITITKQR